MNNPECPECGFKLADDGKYWYCSSWNCGKERISKKDLQPVKSKKLKEEIAKKLKPSQHMIYQIINTGKGAIVYTNFRPTKQDIVDIAIKEYWSGGNEDGIKEAVESGEYYSSKVELYAKE